MRTLFTKPLKAFFVTGIFLTGMIGNQAQAAHNSAHGTRAKQMLIYLMPQVIGGKDRSYANDSQSSIDTRAGFGFGVGYHLNSYIELGVEFLSTRANYSITLSPSDGGEKHTGDLYTNSFNFNVTYNILKAALTPYITGNIGSTFIDSGIDDSSGATLPGCGYDPFGWWYCTEIPATHTTTEVNYGASTGLRYDFNRSVFMKGGIGKNYIGTNSNSPSFVTYQLYLGYTF